MAKKDQPKPLLIPESETTSAGFRRYSINDKEIASPDTTSTDEWASNPSFLQGAQNTNDAGKGMSMYGSTGVYCPDWGTKEYAAQELLRRKLLDQGSSTFVAGVDFGGSGRKK